MRNVICYMLLMMPLWTLAQTAGHAEDFKNNADYIWGQGYGATVKDADQEALANTVTVRQMKAPILFPSCKQNPSGR